MRSRRSWVASLGTTAAVLVTLAVALGLTALDLPIPILILVGFGVGSALAGLIVASARRI